MSSEDGRHADAFYIKKECSAGRSCRRVWRAWFRAVFARFGASADEGEADAETEKKSRFGPKNGSFRGRNKNCCIHGPGGIVHEVVRQETGFPTVPSAPR